MNDEWLLNTVFPLSELDYTLLLGYLAMKSSIQQFNK